MSNEIVLTPLRQKYMETYDQIVAIDTELDAGNDKLGKRAFIKNLQVKYAEQIDHLAVAIDNYFTKTAENGGPNDDLFKVGVVTGLLKKLEEKQEVLNPIVEAALPKDAPVAELSADKIEELTTQRSVLNKMLNAVRSAYAALSGSDETGLPTPKPRTGSRGPRGPRAISAYQFYLNGSQLPGPTNNLATVAKSVEGWKVKNLKEFLVTSEVVKNFKELPDEWTVTLPNGIEFTAKKIEAPVIDDDDDDDETED